jgi:hypothetical protein
MIMTNLLERFLLPCRIAAGLLALLMLTACGPGVGGTGTGAPAGIDVQVYTGAINCSIQCEGIELQVLPGSLTMFTRCNFFLANAEWTIDSEGLAVVQGRLENLSTGELVAATLQLQFSSPYADAQEVTATLMDETGGVLMGETTLIRSQQSGPYTVTGSCR